MVKQYITMVTQYKYIQINDLFEYIEHIYNIFFLRGRIKGFNRSITTILCQVGR